MTIATCIDYSQKVLSTLVPENTRCALIGYPDHWNTGDTAIWVGSRQLLRRIGVHVEYTGDAWSYDPGALAAAVPTGPILLQGGGNFGDIYPDECNLRNRVLADFPHRRIIQLPQSIWFKDAANLKQMARQLDGIHDFTFLARDRASLAIARDHFPVSSLLCPDMALGVPLTHRWVDADRPILALWRDDLEVRSGETLTLPKDNVQDWLLSGAEIRQLSAMTRLFLSVVGTPNQGGPYRSSRRRSLAWMWAGGLWERLAWERVWRGCRMLQQGQVVITNRLHAHLLCSMMQIPHVLCDTTNKKISAYRDTWPIEEPYVEWADSPDEAIEKANQLIRLTNTNSDI